MNRCFKFAFILLFQGCSNGGLFNHSYSPPEQETPQQQEAPVILEPESEEAVVAIKPEDTSETILPEHGEGKVQIKEETEIYDIEQSVVLSKTFASTEQLASSFEFNLDNQDVRSTLEIDPLYLATTKTVKQKDRPMVADNFNQGALGDQQVTTREGNGRPGLADILVVIDNSGSMKEEQEKIGQNLPALLSEISSSNWQIGVVTTDERDGCLRSLIRKEDENAETMFRRAIAAGTRGAKVEKGILQGVNGLKCAREKWLRNGSTLAVIIVSDEDNCSKMQGNANACGNKPWAKPEYLSDYIQNELGRSLGVNAGIYGFFSHPDAPCRTSLNIGYQYAQLISKNNWGDICSADYSPTLRKLSGSIADLLQSQWELDFIPDPGTLVVTVNGVEETSYTLNGKTVTFLAGAIPEKGDSIRFEYLTGTEPMLSSFTLSKPVVDGSVEVKVDGINVTGFTVDTQTKTILFDAPPAPGARIVAHYRLNQTLPKTFPLEAEILKDTLSVTVNGIEINDFVYSEANKNVTIAEAPADGAKVIFGFEKLIGPVGSYGFSPMGQRPRNFQAKNLTSDDNIAVRFNGSRMIFDIGEINPGDMVAVTYEVDDTSSKEFALPVDPLPETVAIKADSECSIGNGLELEGNVLTSQCVVLDNTAFVLSYEYLRHGVTEYPFDISSLPQGGNFQVNVGDETITAFTFEGGIIVLDSPPEEGQLVSIQYIY